MGIVVVEDEKNWSPTSAVRQKNIIEPQLENLANQLGGIPSVKFLWSRPPSMIMQVGSTVPSAATQTCAVQCECPRFDCWYACVPLPTKTFFRHFSLPVIEGNFVFFNITCVNTAISSTRQYQFNFMRRTHALIFKENKIK